MAHDVHENTKSGHETGYKTERNQLAHDVHENTWSSIVVVVGELSYPSQKLHPPTWATTYGKKNMEVESGLTPLEPPNPSLYLIQVVLSPKRVSSCKGVKLFVFFLPPSRRRMKLKLKMKSKSDSFSFFRVLCCCCDQEVGKHFFRLRGMVLNEKTGLSLPRSLLQPKNSSELFFVFVFF